MSTENNFTIKDNSQILSILPKEWSVPLIIIAKVKGYDSVDGYVLEMIRDRLEMFIDTRDELGEDFKKYMQKIEGLEGLSDTEDNDDGESKSEKDYVNVRIDSDIAERLVKLEERKEKQREQHNEDVPDTDENVLKFVNKVHENYLT